jgi:para-aminobenzoate synthetase component 1
VNLTRRLTADGGLDPVALYTSLTARHPAPHTGLLRLSVHGNPIAVVSASPERFVSWRDRDVETRPIKGTDVDPARLRASAKDHAENVMIVDLARNDLGRVCVPGSMHVPTLCALESHPGLHHLVSTVRGTLRPEVGLGALLAATLPPASVTGAPKPRVLQAIEELEPVRRGVYCGAFGWIDTEHGEGDLAVAIRTFTVFPDRTELGVGAGIVADSSPSREWAETELKASRLLAVAGAGALVPS